MSHIHIPDGVIQQSWLIIGFVLTGLIIAFALYKLRHREPQEIVPKLGMMCAIVLLAMSVPLGPIPAHLNLTVFMGIILGPWLGFIAAFIINLLLGFIGHGGLSVVGVNTLLLGTEAALGSLIFKLLAKYINLNKAAATAVVVTLLISNALMIGLVVTNDYAPYQLMESEEHINDHVKEANVQSASGETGNQRTGISNNYLFFGITGLGIVLETIAVTVMIKFLQRVRPDIVISSENNVLRRK